MTMFLWLSISCVVVGLLLVGIGNGYGWPVVSVGTILFFIWILKNPFIN